MVPTFKIHSSKMHWMWLVWVSRSPEASRAAGSPQPLSAEAGPRTASRVVLLISESVYPGHS